MIELDIDEVNATAERAARAAARRVSGSSVEDLTQECWVWIMRNEDRILDWHEDEDGGFGKLYKSLYHYCLDVAQRDHASRTGYQKQDLFYYSIPMLRRMLPWWFEEGLSDPPDVLPDRDMKVDLDNGWKALSVADRNALERAFKGDPDPGQAYQAIAVAWNISDEAARKRVDNSLRRLQEKLGGERPTYHKKRRVVSNAQARAAVANQYDN